MYRPRGSFGKRKGAGIFLDVSDRLTLHEMDSDYAYSSAEESYGSMGSEDEDFDFDSQAEMETHATKVMGFCLWI